MFHQVPISGLLKKSNKIVLLGPSTFKEDEVVDLHAVAATSSPPAQAAATSVLLAPEATSEATPTFTNFTASLPDFGTSWTAPTVRTATATPHYYAAATNFEVFNNLRKYNSDSKSNT
jgi:hypothetical protein